MQQFVTDTMALIRRIQGRELGLKGKIIFEEVETQKSIIYIPTMVLAEIMYLSERKRISISLQFTLEYIQQFPNYKESLIDKEVVQAAQAITDIPELHDRLIAGTAKLLDLPLITNDPKIIVSKFVKTIW
jgi:predicted nucleic acid-binding protein